jgi:hypothetical protein
VACCQSLHPHPGPPPSQGEGILCAHPTWFDLAATLGNGEQEALALAVETPNSLLIMDDGRARRIGRLLGLTMTDTVGILARAKREGLIRQLAPMLEQLEGLGSGLVPKQRQLRSDLWGKVLDYSTSAASLLAIPGSSC